MVPDTGSGFSDTGYREEVKCQETHRMRKNKWAITLGPSLGSSRHYTDQELTTALLAEEAEILRMGKPLFNPDWRNIIITNARTADTWHESRRNNEEGS
jgi:hypothetical protein